MTNISALENKILSTLDTFARLMMPISGDALMVRNVQQRIQNGENRYKIISKYAIGIAFKYSALAYVAYTFVT